MRRIAVLFLCLFSFGMAAEALAELVLKDLGLPDKLFPEKSAYHTIQSVRESSENPGFLDFTVDSPHAVYEVEGLVNLRQRIQEIQVIETLDKQAGGEKFVRGAADSITDTGRGLANFVVHPVKSTLGLGLAVGKLGGKVRGVFRHKEEGEKSSLKESFLGAEKRHVANTLGVDVYSSNPQLQEKLDSIAKLRMGGKGAVAIVKFLIPVGVIASAVMTASNLNDGADKLVNDTDRGDLFDMNKKALIGLGVPPGVVSNLLNDSEFTPREATYIRFYLESLKDVWGNQQIVRAALRAESNTSRAKILHEAEMAANYVSGASGVKKLHVYPEGIALDQGERILFISGYDYLHQSELGERVASKALEVRILFEKKNVELWNAGIIEAGFAEQLTNRGVATRSLVLFRRWVEKTETSPRAMEQEAVKDEGE